MRIGFFQPHLCLRGTTVAMYDYAFYNEKLLDNESVIFYEEGHPYNDASTMKKFSKFECVAIPNIGVLDDALSVAGCEAVYITKGGRKNDGRMAHACKTLIHAIAPVSPAEKHGDVYAYGSYWLSEHCSQGEIPAVPYMVDLPDISDDLRDILGIPVDAVVFGRNGGRDTWDLPFANDAVKQVLENRKDAYFVFQNTPIPFIHDRIKIIPSTADLEFKTKFINTCDAMIHARYIGESFGLSCGEFSIRNKAVITWSGSPERNHIEILGDRGIYYSNKEQMADRLMSFEKRPEKDWNCYRDYAPEKVMKIFEEVYLK